MNNSVIDFKNIDDLLLRLSKVFKNLLPEEVRELTFFLQNFRNEHSLPYNTIIYAMTVDFTGLEVLSEDKISEIKVAGIAKGEKFKVENLVIPPIVVLRGQERLIILFGEDYAIESYARGLKQTAIFLDIDYENPYKLLKIDPYKLRFFEPLVRKYLKKMNR